MNNTALRRIKKEYDMIQNDLPDNFVAGPIKVQLNLNHRMIYLPGILRSVELKIQNLKEECITELSNYLLLIH